MGPNATTWLLPSEVFPTDMRTLGHGLSATAGKMGALFAAYAFGVVEPKTMFTLCSVCCLLGLAATLLFVPDETGVTLDEIDGESSFAFCLFTLNIMSSLVVFALFVTYVCLPCMGP